MRVILIALVVAVLAAGCGGDDNESSSDDNGASQTVVDAAMLRVTDLPGTWVEQDLEPDVEGDELCGGIELEERGRTVAIANAAFLSRDGLEPVVAQSVAAYAANHAEEVFDELRSGIEECIANRVNTGQSGVQLSTLEFRRFGDATFAAIIASTPDAPISLAFNYVLVRRGGFLQLIVFGAAGVPDVDPTRTESIVVIADAKLENAIAAD